MIEFNIIKKEAKTVPDYRKEYLGSGITCFVSDDHTFGTDAVLLADFAAPKQKDTCCDFGSGCGIIPLLWCKTKAGHITALEIQESGYKLISGAVEYNNLEDRITPLQCDLREIKGVLPFGAFSLVTMNPPYTAKGSGLLSESASDKIARHGTMCTLEDVCMSASGLLNFGGRFCTCIRPERLCEMFGYMREAAMEPKRIRFVSKEDGKAPWLVLIEAKKGGKPGLTAEPELHIYGNDGQYSDKMKEIYKDYLLENRGDNR